MKKVTVIGRDLGDENQTGIGPCAPGPTMKRNRPAVYINIIYIKGMPPMNTIPDSESFDRSGGNVNPSVYSIEREGMEAADRIITVSNLTRNTVIGKYNIDPAKVVTVYNAVEQMSESEKRSVNMMSLLRR